MPRWGRGGGETAAAMEAGMGATPWQLWRRWIWAWAVSTRGGSEDLWAADGVRPLAATRQGELTASMADAWMAVRLDHALSPM